MCSDVVFKAISQEINILRNSELARYTTEVCRLSVQPRRKNKPCPVNFRSASHIGFSLRFSWLPSARLYCGDGEEIPKLPYFYIRVEQSTQTCNHRVGVPCRSLDPLFLRGDFNTSYRRVGGSVKFQIYCRRLLGPSQCVCVPIQHTFLVTLSLKKYV